MIKIKYEFIIKINTFMYNINLITKFIHLIIIFINEKFLSISIFNSNYTFYIFNLNIRRFIKIILSNLLINIDIEI